uniref:Uncharacterized protein n=1 Tax=Avena sativa TaxID=4498 RepID=A0ACD5YB94_AVESA
MTNFVRAPNHDGLGSSRGLVEEDQEDEEEQQEEEQQHEDEDGQQEDQEDEDGQQEEEEEVEGEEEEESGDEILQERFVGKSELASIPPPKEKVFLRGVSKLPNRPYALKHIRLKPTGKTGFEWLGPQKPKRAYGGIIGCLIREYFPGLVKMPDGSREPAWTWDHYKHAEDSKYGSAAERFFTLVEGIFEEGCKVVVEKAKKLIPEMHYDARVNCVTNWYGHEKKIAMPKKRARKRLLTREQYLKVPPQYTASKGPCFQLMVARWVSKDYVEAHMDAMRRREMLGEGTHRQGNLTITGVIQKRARTSLTFRLSVVPGR